MKLRNDLFSIVIETAENIHPGLPDIIEYGMDCAPYLGSILQTRKINRFARRLNEHNDQLIRISKLYSESLLTDNFVQERISPIVLSDLIEEHEDSKINLILNGYENVFIENNTNESVIINYFDTLRNLRYADLKRFLYFANKITDYPDYPDSSHEKALTRMIDGKLEISGLIKIGKTWGQ